MDTRSDFLAHGSRRDGDADEVENVDEDGKISILDAIPVETPFDRSP